MVDTRNLSSDFVSETGARFTYYLASGLVIIFLSRELDPSAYGTLFLALSVLTVSRLFSSMGLAKAAAKHVSTDLGVDRGQIRHVVLRSFTLNLGTIVVVSVVATAGAAGIADALGAPAIAPLVGLGFLYIVFATLYNYTRVLLQGFEDITASAVVYASEGVGKLVTVVVLVTLGYGIYGAFLGFVVGFALAALIGLWLLYTRLPAKDETDPIAKGLTKRILKYSLPLAVTRGAWVLDREIDIIVVGYLLTPAVVAYYTISKQLVNFCSGVAGSLGFSLGPQFDEQTVAERPQHARTTYESALVYLLLVYVPAVSGLAILADPVVTTVFGAEYQRAVPILQVFCAGIVLMAVTELTEDILDYLGRANARAVFKSLTSVGNVVFSIALIGVIGAVGAAVATVCMQAIYATLCLAVIKSELDLRTGYLARQVGQVVVITVVMSGVVLVFTQYAGGLLMLGASIVSGIVVWGCLAVKGGFFELDSIRRVASRGSNSE